MIDTSGAYVVWKGEKFHKDPPTKRIEENGELDDLLAPLPAAYEPPVVAEFHVQHIRAEGFRALGGIGRHKEEFRLRIGQARYLPLP